MRYHKRVTMMEHRVRAGVFLLAFLLLAALLPAPAAAFHDQGYPCYQCHSLKPSEIRAGSNAIRIDQFVLTPIPTPSGATAWTGGMPITCDFCHKAADDVPTQNFAVKTGSKHPVRTVMDNGAKPNEIACGDCHNGNNGGVATPDLTPLSMTTKNATDGYPDHDNMAAGYVHNLTSNPPHLTVPYWGSTLPGFNRGNDTTFWTAVRAGTQDIVCWVCHESGRTNSPTRGPLTNVVSTRSVKGDYVGTDNTKGHKIRVNMGAGALGAGSSLPCYDCHDSHGSMSSSLILDNQSIYGDNTSRVSVTTFTGANDRVVCAQCHDTGNTATALTKAIPAQAGKLVEGMYPVDPFNSTTSGTLHATAGILDNMANSTKNCLAANAGCHASPHNPVVPCAICHGPGGSGPTVVWPSGNASGKTSPYGSHLGALRSDNLSATTDWNMQCNKCHNGHAGPVLVPMPPTNWTDPSGRLTGTNMAVQLGLDNYAVDNGVRLGGTATSGTTEADICWNCHVAQTPAPVSEWGFNTKKTPTGFPVVLDTSPGNFPTQHDGTADRDNFGHIYTDNSYATLTSDWTAGYWMDEYDNVIRRRIASIHSASFDPAGQSSSVAANINTDNTVNHTTPTLENKAYIRCSYCHDVHDLNKAQNDTASGNPFLRGTWVSNPYPPDLPPRSTYSYTTGPRATSANRERGGYFIDQNSGWPTDNPAMDTLAEIAGICTLCHGTTVDTMKFYTGSSLWRAGMVNGHSNSTLGGTRSNARDIFSASRGQVSPAVCGMGQQMCAGGEPCLGNYYRACVPACGACCTVLNDGWYGGVNPPNLNTCTGFDGDYANWYGTGTIGGAKGAASMAHKFTCSKCHTPHASGLPVLLVHNCVDTVLSNPANNPQDLRAVNCHRKTTTTDGWHRLAPGQ
ncbi:MAG TPA: hypothetical protein VN450_02305 [Candidatus Methylomirabilis sp.]|nr:hypothetical protein [Candidatus Methylomirabilis sp.]